MPFIHPGPWGGSSLLMGSLLRPIRETGERPTQRPSDSITGLLGVLIGVG